MHYVTVSQGMSKFEFFVYRSDVDAILDEIVSKEPLVTANRTSQVRQLIERLQQKIGLNDEHKFYLFKVSVCIALASVSTNLLPLELC